MTTREIRRLSHRLSTINRNSSQAVRDLIARLGIRSPRRKHWLQVYDDPEDANYCSLTAAVSKKDLYRIRVLAANEGKPVGILVRETLQKALNLRALPYEIEMEAEQLRDRARVKPPARKRS